MQNNITILATATVADTVIKLAEVGSGHHVISYKVITDKRGDNHEATMHIDKEEAEWFYHSKIASLVLS